MMADPVTNSFLNKVERTLTGPSNNDFSVKALRYTGAGLATTGLILIIIGGYVIATGKPQKESSDAEPVAQNIVTDSIARLSGLGTAIFGVLCTIGGATTMVLAKEAIFRLQSLMDQHRIDC